MRWIDQPDGPGLGLFDMRSGLYHIGPVDHFWLSQFVPHSLKKKPIDLESDLRWMDYFVGRLPSLSRVDVLGTLFDALVWGLTP